MNQLLTSIVIVIIAITNINQSIKIDNLQQQVNQLREAEQLK